MQAPILNATTRTVIGKQVKQLRRQGKMPGVLYGHGTDSQSILLDALEYTKLFHKAGTSTLVDLIIDEKKPVKVLLHEPDYHPAKPITLHADFYAVKMSEKLQTEIPLHIVGEAEAVTVLDGTLNQPLDALNVECFPDKLVPSIEVDITVLKTLEDMIRVSDITLPDGIEVLNDPEEVIFTVTPPRSEEELAELEEAPTGEAADQAAVEALEVEEKKTDEATEEDAK